MVAGLEDSTPRYLSARSSDVILSDIRPMKLKVEALRAINAFLDELLWNILSVSRSLTTDRIKASLLKVLPTTLGKEALLEAEVELKAYWERTNPTSNQSATVVEGEQFPLQWSFELLRLKCEAYSTLNDSDEDVSAENRLSERMRDLGYAVTPQAALVAPAALYLTAIIEYICEHVLSNISRVVARDSSRTSATPYDLFIALCEDGTVYDTFRSMKVYDHIENLQKSSRLRRSKSFSRDKLVTTSRTSSQHSDLSSSQREGSSAQSRVRVSSESITSGATAVQLPSRGSLDRAKSNLFGHSKAPSDTGTESQSLYKKMESGYADSMKDSLVDVEDQMLMDEFDELMRSGATMKVSLTPDRLKSMEVYNKEKNRRGTAQVSANKRAVVNGHQDEELSVTLPDPKRAQRVPTLRRVDSIIEDEEDIHTATPTGMMSLPATPQSHTFPISSAVDAKGRLRSMSTSHVSGPPQLLRKSSWSSAPKARSTISQKRDLAGSNHLDVPGKPARTRKLQRNIENMDLDEIMNGPDDEEEEESAPPSSYKRPMKTLSPSGLKMSTTTQELISFLAEGPPEEPQRPTPATRSGTKAKPGRLGRMMSRLTGSPSTERLRELSIPRAAGPVPPPSAKGFGHSQQLPYVQSSLPSMRSHPGVIVGTPPRPPRVVQPIAPLSPPISSLDEKYDLEESPSSQGTHKVISPRKPVPPFEPVKADPTRLAPPPSRQSSRASSIQSSSTGPVVSNGRVNGNGTKREPPHSPRTDADAAPKPEHEVRRPLPPLSTDRVQEFRRLLASATNADECRVLVDMFLAGIGFPVDRTGPNSPYPSPIPDPEDMEMENSIVEVLLGGASGSSSVSSHSTRSEASGPQNNDNTILSAASPRSESLKSVQDTKFRQHPPRTLTVG